MEMQARFASAVEEVARYVDTRLSPAVYVPLSFFLCAAAAVGHGYPRWTEWASGTVLAYLLLFQHRLWDDLADRRLDEAKRPRRVLVESTALTKYRILVAVLFVANVTVIALQTDRRRTAACLLLNASLLGWYGGLRDRFTSSAVRSHVLLLKYPAMVYVLSGLFPASDSLLLLVLMGTVYLCFCTYESLHDPVSMMARRPRWLLLIEMTILVTVSVWMALLFRQTSPGFTAMQGALAAGAAVLAAQSLRRHRAMSRTGLWVHAPFFIGAAQVLMFSVWRAS